MEENPTSWWAVVFLTVWSLFWILGTAAFVVTFISQSYREGTVHFGIALFLTPFVLIALAALYIGGRFYLSLLLVGKTTIVVEKEPLEPGDSVIARLYHKSDYSINSLSVRLKGNEIYDPGGDSTAKTDCFYDTELFQQKSVRGFVQRPIAQFPLSVPKDAKGSYRNGSYRVESFVEVKMKLSLRPNVKAQIPIRIVNKGDIKE